MSLLIIEDSFDLVELYRLALGMVGIKPEVESTGPSAKRRIESNGEKPQVVILDLHLIGEGGVEVNGLELFDLMRSRWPKTKIIVSSADVQWCNQLEGRADLVVQKPITNMKNFLDSVQTMMK